ncbi:MAG TPA: class I SAM-dependent methyltransferase [Vicinamibacterales bacterium]|nr:class I SAM-dependent methyltransferase [Vicinamibacterales bacterium]
MENGAPTLHQAKHSLYGVDLTRLVLDRVHNQMLRHPEAPSGALDMLSSELLAAKREQAPSEWAQTIEMARRHPLRELLHQDPLTARAFAMSRGYQGDAELLDIIYDRDYRRCWPQPVTAFGDAIFRYTINCQAPEAVRERRAFLAREIDLACAANPKVEILSAACGHCRELELSEAIQARTFGRFVGLDQDRETLDYIQRVWGPHGVEPMAASVTAFLLNSQPLEQFDFVYSAGLYDYLEPGVVDLVTHKLIEMVRPGGRLLVGNYTPDTRDAGYMEAFMGWQLIYRDAPSMRRLAEHRRVADVSIVRDTTGAVIYLDARIG